MARVVAEGSSGQPRYLSYPQRPIASIQTVHRMEVNSETKTIEVYALADNE